MIEDRNSWTVRLVSGPLTKWQKLHAGRTTGEFFDFCNMIEYKEGQTVPDEGWGLDNALANWAGNTTALYGKGA